MSEQQPEDAELAFPDLQQGIAWGESITQTRADVLDARLKAWKEEKEHGERKGPFDASRLDETERERQSLTGADVFWLAARMIARTSEPRTVASGMRRLRQAREDYHGGFGLDFSNLNLTGANLNNADLAGANLRKAILPDANLHRANLSGADIRGVNLSGVNLRAVRMSVETELSEASLSSKTLLADVIWNSVPLARMDWEALPIVGDETLSRLPQDDRSVVKVPGTPVEDYQAAARAYRLLAVTLRSQGLNEAADRYAYRAQLMQRVVLRRQAFERQKGKHVGLSKRLSKFAGYLGSGLLDAIAGYGYKPMRSLIAYIAIVILFTGAYLLNAQFSAPHLTWDEALVLSISAFHGRGFFTSGISLGDTLARLAAGEAIIGLLIEITFIATFTQRFFAR